MCHWKPLIFESDASEVFRAAYEALRDQVWTGVASGHVVTWSLRPMDASECIMLQQSPGTHFTPPKTSKPIKYYTWRNPCSCWTQQRHKYLQSKCAYKARNKSLIQCSRRSAWVGHFSCSLEMRFPATRYKQKIFWLNKLLASTIVQGINYN